MYLPVFCENGASNTCLTWCKLKLFSVELLHYEVVMLQHLSSSCVGCTLKMLSYASCYFPAGGRCVRTCSLSLQSAAGTVRDGMWTLWRYQEAAFFDFTSAHHRIAMGNQSQISTPLWPAPISEHWHGEIKGWILFSFQLDVKTRLYMTLLNASWIK